MSDDVRIALLRGINVGGKNRLPMDDLRRIFREAGCDRVETYIQSGNVVFEAGAEAADRVADRVAEAIADEFGHDVPVVTRSRSEFEAVVEDNPFLAAGADPKLLHVAFLAEAPDEGAVEDLDLDRFPPDEFVVRGRDVFLCCPNGMARTKLTNRYFDSRLGTTSTMRNWRTVLKLVEMARDPGTP